MIGFRLVGERLEPGDRMAPEVSTPVPGKKETQAIDLGFLGVAIVCVGLPRLAAFAAFVSRASRCAGLRP